MMGLFGSNDITGIDIGAGGIKVARIAANGKRSKLLSVALMELPLDPAQAMNVSAALRALLAGKKLGARNIVTQLPGRHLTIRPLTLPRMPLDELREAVRWEAKRHISYPLDAAQVEFLIVGEKNDGGVEKYDLLLVVAERAKVRELLLPFDEIKIKVSAVDANALSLRNVLRLSRQPAGTNTLVVDLGAAKTEIDIFKGGVLRFSRCIEFGGLDMTRAVADTLNVGLQEAEEWKRALNILSPAGQDQAVAAVLSRLDGLLMEVRRSVEYYKTTFHEPGVEETILTGGVALMGGLKEYFAKSLEGTVEIVDPFEGLTHNNNIMEEFGPIATRFSAAIGLGLRKA